MAVETRRCPASQFFQEEDESAAAKVPTSEKVVDLLNQASLQQKDHQRITLLKKVQELIVHKDPGLLDNFLDEMLAFQSDRSNDVKKVVITFMEEACKKDPDILPKVMGNLAMLLQSDSVMVTKKVILVLAQLVKVTCAWINKAKTVTEEMEQTWAYILQTKNQITELIDSTNDGVRTHSIKYLEAVVLALSAKTEESDIPKYAVSEFSLDQLTSDHSLLKKKKLEEEGKRAFEKLMAYEASSHISSINLMTCLSSLTAIAKQRPQFMTRVVQGFEALHVNLPPTLANSQVSSVRKNLKMQMLSLLKHPASVDFHPQITTLLTDLGATQTEVMKALPKEEVSRKRKVEEPYIPSKKPKPEIPEVVDDDVEDDYGMTPFHGPSTSSSKPKSKTSEADKQTAIDVTAEDLIDRLSAQNVADLVLLSMVMLPDKMPAQFQATYTPIAAAGTQAQIKHLARLLATQLTAHGLGKGIAEVQRKMALLPTELETEEDDQPSSPKHVIRTVVGGHIDPGGMTPARTPAMPPPVTVPTRKAIRAFKLSSVTKSLNLHQMEDFALQSMKRILAAEGSAQQGNVVTARTKILTSLVSQFGGALRTELFNYIFADLRERSDLALAWIYQEYANYQGFNVSSSSYEKPSLSSYDECLTRLLNGLLERPDQREGLFSRLILEAPYITPNAIQVLRKYCQDETRIYLGMTTLKELIVKRPCMKLEFLDVLLDFTSHEKNEVRSSAIQVTKSLHEKTDLQKPIEKYALYYLKFLLQPRPPAELFGPGKGKIEHADGWVEDTIKLSLYLYLGLLPVNHTLIHELANVYTATSADVKRTILRVLETPVKGMGMESPELLLLVENCPKGAETLVTRIIHILTDKATPSPELVDRVRDLYHKRVSDVRFLIPVLNGLTKKEVMFALPKLIKLNPVVVKEVFNRLLGSHGQEIGQTSMSSPLSPSELLIALHTIDHSKCDMRTIIKATNLCFAEKEIYTQEVLAVVMQNLMDQNPLPTLLMRTVIQSLAMYPRLIGFVMNIMQRLIQKQVWKQQKVWEGFVKCCQRTKPHCFQVLLGLPAPQLKNIFELAPELREPLLAHIQSFTPHQRAHIPKAIMSVLEKDPVEEQRAAEKAKKEEEERLAAQEKLYQQKLEEERRKQQEKVKHKQDEEHGEKRTISVVEMKTESKEVLEKENASPPRKMRRQDSDKRDEDDIKESPSRSRRQSSDKKTEGKDGAGGSDIKEEESEPVALRRSSRRRK